MKRILATAAVLCLLIPSILVTTFAASASASLTGPTTVSAGGRVTLSLRLTGQGLLGTEFYVNFDPDQLTYNTYGSELDDWEYNRTGDKTSGTVYFLCNYASASGTINGTKQLLTITFDVKSSVKPGDRITVSTSGMTVSDGNEDMQASATYTATVASSDCTLRELTVENAELKPAFSPTVTSYTASMAYTTATRFNIRAVPTDSAATATATNTTPKDGSSTITVTVTAQDGTKRTYTVNVTIAPDPNKKDDNSSLSSLTVSEGSLSPAFSGSVTRYTVQVPYATRTITVSGRASSSAATVSSAQQLTLNVGENTARLVCTAEDGSRTEYTVTVTRLTENDEQTSAPSETEQPDTSDETSPVTDYDSTPAETDGMSADSGQGGQTPPSEDTAPLVTEDSRSDDTGEPGGEHRTGLNRTVPVWVLLISVLVSLIVGAAAGAVIFKK